jgi:hypothetical protein
MEKIFPKLNYIFYKDKLGWRKVGRENFQKLLEKLKSGQIEKIDIEHLPQSFVNQIVKIAEENGFCVKLKEYILMIAPKKLDIKEKKYQF